jgi:hypothetical protein
MMFAYQFKWRIGYYFSHYEIHMIRNIEAMILLAARGTET